MSETVHVYDLDNQPVYDPEQGDFWAIDIKTDSMWPKGFGVATFTFRRKHPWSAWVIKEDYGVKIMDGTWITWMGRAETIRKNLAGHELQVTCVGWYVMFEEGLIHKRWVDILGVEHLHWPAGVGTERVQTSFVCVKRDNSLRVNMGTRDIQRDIGELYRELYRLPAGTVRRVEFDYSGRTGEQIMLQVYNLGTGLVEVQKKFGSSSGSISHAFTGATRSFEVRVVTWQTDTYDQNDYVIVDKLKVEANYETGHPNFAAPSYTQKELIIDIILLLRQAGANLSADFSQIVFPNTVLYPYEMDRPDYAGRVVEDILSYGDNVLSTWGLTVFDNRSSSDGLPQVATSFWNVDDYEYQIELSDRELQDIQEERISSDFFNHVVVGYVDSQGALQYLTPEDYPELKDVTSIANGYRRGYYLELQQSDQVQALALGKRFLQYHRNRVFSGSFRVTGTIQTRAGYDVPVNRVRAGQRVKVVNTGEIFFLRHVAYDAESRQATLSPEMSKDNIRMFLVRQERQKKYNQAPEGMF